MTHTESCPFHTAPFPDNHGWLPWACWAVLGGDVSMLGSSWRDEYRLLPLDAARAAFQHGLMDDDGVGMLIDPPDSGIRRWSITLPGVMGWRLTASQNGSGVTSYGVRNGGLAEITGYE